MEKEWTLFESYQAESFLFLNESIAGVKIQNMTIRHYLILDGIDSPLLYGNEASAEDFAKFLWILSPDFSSDEKKRNEFLKEVRKIPMKNAVQDVTEYLKKTFQDADIEESKKEKSYANFVSYLIDLFAREYHWTISEVMNLPLRVAYQLISSIQERYSKQNGEKYSKLRQIDMLTNEHILKSHKENQNGIHRTHQSRTRT